MMERHSDSRISELSEFVAARTALHFPRERWADLESKAGSAAKEFGFADVDAFIGWLISSPLSREQMEILASHLTIAETYFWREPQVFEALEEWILPELIRSRENGDRRLRIWSAGCATGEEPYSIAIALRRVLPALEKWHVTILATDINPRILRRAAAGVYRQWSFRNAPPWLKDGFFHEKKGDVFEILPEIRKMVTFAYLNLAEDIYPSPLNDTNAMDIIFCRNVLMYFEPGRARQIGAGLYSSLVDGGWLAVAASELNQQMFSSFLPVHFPEAFVYRKDGSKAGPSAGRRLTEAAFSETARQAPFAFTAELSPAALPPPAPASLEKGEEMPAVPIRRPERTGGEAPEATAMGVRALANQGCLAEALALGDKALIADRLRPDLYYLRAMILQELNRLEEAGVSLKRALYIDPDFLLAHFALGNLAVRQGKSRAAKKYFKNVLALLNSCGQDDILPESEGLTAGRFREIIQVNMRIGEWT
jgi:chemotaxis protein methyltransferase CheR